MTHQGPTLTNENIQPAGWQSIRAREKMSCLVGVAHAKRQPRKIFTGVPSIDLADARSMASMLVSFRHHFHDDVQLQFASLCYLLWSTSGITETSVDPVTQCYHCVGGRTSPLFPRMIFPRMIFPNTMLIGRRTVPRIQYLLDSKQWSRCFHTQS